MVEPAPKAARQIKLKSPMLRIDELDKLRDLAGTWRRGGARPLMAGRFRSTSLSTLYKVHEGGPGLQRAMAELCRQASAAIAAGNDFIILSDRGIDHEHAAIPALLAVAGAHHHLIRER